MAALRAEVTDLKALIADIAALVPDMPDDNVWPEGLWGRVAHVLYGPG